MRRPLAVFALVLLVGLVVALVLFLAGPVEAKRRGPDVSCGSVLFPVEPDPTAEAEFGCTDLFNERKGWALLVGGVGSVLVMAVTAAAVLQNAAVAREATTPRDVPL